MQKRFEDKTEVACCIAYFYKTVLHTECPAENRFSLLPDIVSGELQNLIFRPDKMLRYVVRRYTTCTTL